MVQTSVGDRGLGRHISPEDPRDQDYPVARPVNATLLGEEGYKPLREAEQALERGWRYWWPSGWWGDQGNYPWCMAYGCLHIVADGPNTTTSPAPLWDPRWTYCEIQKLDPWEGDCENPLYDGGAVRSGYKLLRREGVIDRYWWAWTVEDVVEALLTVGPVGLGATWFSGMFDTDRDGFIYPTGNDRGGHFVALNGVNRERGVIRGKNSWSRRWGDYGYFWLHFESLETLLKKNGEAVVATWRT